MHYELELYTRFKEKEPEATTIEELAHIWKCSPRYAKTMVRKLAGQNSVSWQTFQGRGKKPILTLNRSKLDAIYDIFHGLWEQNEYDHAYSLLIKYNLLHHPAAEGWLSSRYGVQQAADNSHIFREPFYKTEVRFDPLYGISRHDFHFAKQLHETLFTYSQTDNEVRPNLLFHYESEDYQTWRFVLRKEIYFHHHEQMTANDVKRSLERAADFTNTFFTYSEITAVNDWELIIKLTEPFSLLPRCLSSIRTAILPANHKEGRIGCGAFSLAASTEDRLHLSVFRRYFKMRPWIDGIEMIYTNDLRSFGVSAVPFKSGHYSCLEFKEEGADFVFLNARSGPLAQPSMRETVYSLIHSEDYVVKEWGESAAGSWSWNRKGMDAKADTLIAAEQFPVLKICVQQIRKDASHEREAVILQRALHQYGITSTLEMIDLQKNNKPNIAEFDLFVGGYSVGEDYILSLFNIYRASTSPVPNMAGSQAQEVISDRLQSAAKTNDSKIIMEHLDKIESMLVQTYSLKFLAHRSHHLYIREDAPYKSIQFDQHGRIDYKCIYS